ncbi:hypothetical protein B6E66_20195 [Streptomyces maremycinicus]|nr:hypothetical protein B6E66_20195 [Streptomyces sp. B9173]
MVRGRPRQQHAHAAAVRPPRASPAGSTVLRESSRGRGAGRVVSGRGGGIYYTDDHYDRFRAVLR